MKRYYDFSLDELYNLSPYQWNSYMGEIPETMKMLSGGSGEKGKSNTESTEELMKRAKKAGIKTPTNY
jgi:hypothetical protein